MLFQAIGNSSFKQQLKLHSIEYVDLPILNYEIIYYKWEDKERYALIRSGEYEEVFITDSIPLDLNWGLFLQDCRNQLDGEPPMEMETKARKIILEAESRACADVDVPDLFDPAPSPSMADIKIEIIKMGFSVKELKQMKHQDVDPDFWKSLIE